MLAEQPVQLRAQPPGRLLQARRLLRPQQTGGQRVPGLEEVGVAVPVQVVGPPVVARRVGVRLLQEVVDVSQGGRLGRFLGQAALRGGGEDLGHVILVPGQLRPRLVPRPGVVRGQAAGVGEERGNVLRPHPAELASGLLPAQRTDHGGQFIRVLADRRVRRLSEVLVAANATPHHVGRQHRVLPQQRLQAQGGVCR